MSIRLSPVHRSVALALAAALALVGLTVAESASAPAAHAADVVVYDSMPATLPSQTASLAFGATQTGEFGELVELAGSARQVAAVEVGFTSWACQESTWNTGDCVTEVGATFTHPVTLNLYAEGDGTMPGALLASVTQPITAPFRPSPDTTNCTGADAGKWWDGVECFDGLAFTASFDFSAVAPTVPDRVIVGVAFNTNNYGSSPLTTPGPYDVLNVSVRGDVTVGSDVDGDTVYWKTAFASYYMDGGEAGVDVFRTGTWADYYNYSPLMIRITASAPTVDEPPAASNPVQIVEPVAPQEPVAQYVPVAQQVPVVTEQTPPPSPVTAQIVLTELGSSTAQLLERYQAANNGEAPPPAAEVLTIAAAELEAGTGAILPTTDFVASMPWTGSSADQWVDVWAYSTPTYIGTFPVINGVLKITGADLSALAAGDHHLVLVGQTSGASEVMGFAIAEPATVPGNNVTADPDAATPDVAAGSLDLGWLLWVAIAVLAIAAIATIGTVVKRRRA